MGKAKRFNSYDQAVQDQRNIVQNYGQGRQGLSGIRSSFRTSPPSPISDFDPNREENIATVVADNLGNHTATQDLNLAGNDIILSSDGDTKFNVVGANVLFQCSNSGASTEVFRISATELQMAQNIDVNEKDIENVNMITFKDDHNNNFIKSSTSGIVYNAHSNDHHKFYSGLTALVTIDTANISLGAPLDMDTNNISSCGNISFHTHSGASAGQNISTSTDGLLYQATNPDTHDFLVSAVSRFEIEQSKISLKEDTELTGGKRLASSSATEIGIFVRNETGTIGTLGTVQLPEYTATTAPTNGTLDTNFGAFQGSSGIFRDTDTTAGSRFYIRGSDGNWYYSFLTQQT